MGGAVSAGQDNDELVDNLKEAEYIKSWHVERVFRVVDRAHYYLVEYRKSAYKDLAWKSGTLHLSAPCIYSEVLEALELQPGMSFLNLGSGTGYLNTMAGYMIGPYGINHGIELHKDNVVYAEEKLESFKQTAPKFDDFELCEPHFVVGNCLNLAPENRLYDRVYCGAACPMERKETIQNLVKVGGVLVVPVGDQLLKIKRESETEFSSNSVLPVSFASLVVPMASKDNVQPVMLPEVNPLSLQCICRIAVRESIRQTFSFEQPPQNVTHEVRPSKARKILKHDIRPLRNGLMIMGRYDNSDPDEQLDDTSDEDYLERELQRHAQVLRRVSQRLIGMDQEPNTDEIDSDISDMEEPSGNDSKDLNGNKASDQARGTDTSLKEIPEAMESEDGTTADDEGEEEEEKDESKQALERGAVLHAKEEMEVEHCDSPINASVDKADSCLNGKGKESGTNNCEKTFYPSTSSDGETCQTTSQPVDIQNLCPTTQGPQPRRTKPMYSTSGDTSETSGFGSLGEEIPRLGSQVSTDGSVRDELSDCTMEPHPTVFGSLGEDGTLLGLQTHAQTSGNSGVSEDVETAVCRAESPTLHTSTENKSSGPTTLEVGNHLSEESSTDAGWLIEDVDDNEDDDDDDDDDDGHDIVRKWMQSRKKNIAQSLWEEREESDGVGDGEEDEEEEEEERRPRGPDFTAFLKEKVDTLPIPSSLKAFILHYR